LYAIRYNAEKHTGGDWGNRTPNAAGRNPGRSTSYVNPQVVLLFSGIEENNLNFLPKLSEIAKGLNCEQTEQSPVLRSVQQKQARGQITRTTHSHELIASILHFGEK
jgi:hypothetical protein